MRSMLPVPLVLLLAVLLQLLLPPPPPFGAAIVSAGPSAASLRGELAHWAHPLLRWRVFGHLADATVDAGYTAALHAELESVVAGKAKRSARKAARIELVEFGSGRWAVEAARWIIARQVPGSSIRLRATVVAQEAVYADLARATVATNINTSSTGSIEVRVVYEDSGTWRGVDGIAVELKQLPRHDIVVCDSFGSPLDRLLGQASILTALHRAGRLAKSFAIVPAEVTLYAQAVQSDALRRRDRVPDPMAGLRMGAFDKFVRKTAQASIVVDMETLEWNALSDKLHLGESLSMRDPRTFYSVALSEVHLRLEAATPSESSETESFVASAEGRLDAIVVWTQERLRSTQRSTAEEPKQLAPAAAPKVLSTDPSTGSRHRQWGQMAYFFREDRGQTLAKGQAIAVSGHLSSNGLQLHIVPDGTSKGGQLLSGNGDIEQQTIPAWNAEDYVRMLNDSPRNEVYDRAVTAAVHMARDRAAAAALAADANSSAALVQVLDIGSGEGLLSLVAARAGADRVTALEMNPSIARVSRAVIEENKMSDVITVVQAHSRSVEMKGVPQEQRPNLLVSEVVDASLFGEGILSTVCHATRELLSQDAIILPQSATLYAAAIESETARQGHTDHMAVAHPGPRFGANVSSVDLSEWSKLLSDPLDTLSGSCLRDSHVDVSPSDHEVSQTTAQCLDTVKLTHQPFDAQRQPQLPIFLTEKSAVGTVNLSRCQQPDELEWKVELPVRIEPGGRVDAVLVWFELTLLETHNGEGSGNSEHFRLNTGPEEAGILGHWGQASFFIPPPQPYLEAGDMLSFTLRVVPKLAGPNTGHSRRAHGGDFDAGSVLELLWSNPTVPARDEL